MAFVVNQTNGSMPSLILSPTGPIAKANISRAGLPSCVPTRSSEKLPSSMAIAIFISSNAR